MTFHPTSVSMIKVKPWVDLAKPWGKPTSKALAAHPWTGFEKPPMRGLSFPQLAKRSSNAWAGIPTNGKFGFASSFFHLF